MTADAPASPPPPPPRPPPAPARPRVVIAGAGVAGMAAAHVLSGAGVDVTVVEKSTGVGGRCFSYVDPELGHTVEHGIHGVFPRYLNLQALWREAGIPESVLGSTRTTGMAGADGKMHATELAGVHGAPPFFLLRMTPKGVLRLRDYVLAARFLARTYASPGLLDPSLDQLTFAALLDESGVSRRTAELLLVPYVKNLSYARADEVSALAAASALDFYVVEDADDVKARFFDGGPCALVFEPWQRWLAARGVTFLLSTPVEQVVVKDGRFVSMATRAIVAEAELGAAERLWTQDLGGRLLALHWQPAGRTLRAFDARCTHQGCALGVDATAQPPCLRCPCHGGRFSADGQVLNPPPKAPLAEVPLRHDAQAGVFYVDDGGAAPPPAGASQPPAAIAGDVGVVAMDVTSAQRALPRELLLAGSTAGVAALRATSVVVLRMRFAPRAGQPRWSGPDSGVFAASDALDNFFALHTFQREFRDRDDLHLECHVGDGMAMSALGDDDLYDRALGVLERYFPDEGLRARLDRAASRVLRHESGFPLFAPGDAARAPTVSDPRRPNLLFAGDWVRPDDVRCRAWFMERAAITGIEAANAALRVLGLADRARPVRASKRPEIGRWVALPFTLRRRLSAALRRLFDV